jgi:Trypsin-like peptidase domain
MRHGWWTRLAGVVPASLVAACLAAPTTTDRTGNMAAPPVEPADAIMATSIDWSDGSDCVTQLRRLKQAAQDGLLSADDRPPIAVVLVSEPRSWLDAAPPQPIDDDLPLEVHEAASTVSAACVIRIGPARNLTAAHRAVDLQDVDSVYQSGVRRERNPDYDAAQRALREAKDDAEGRPRVMSVDDPLLDLIGTTVGSVIGAIDDRVGQHQIDTAAAQMAATPRSRDEPVYRPYNFERVVVRAQKEAVVHVALLDAGGRLLRATDLRQRELREFFVLHGLEPRDRDYEQHRSSSMTDADLARWARTPPTLRLSSIAAALLDGNPESTALASIPPGVMPAAAPELAALEKAPTRDDRAITGPMDPIEAEIADLESDDWLDQQGTITLPPSAPEPDPSEPHLGLDLVDLGQEHAADRLLANPRDTIDPRAASVVRIEADRGAARVPGTGFYVRRDFVLTALDVVQGASVVDVTTADGATVPALVANIDSARNLALVQVPRPGPALTLYQGAALDAGLPVEALGEGGAGRPVFLRDGALGQGRVIGMTAGGSSGAAIIEAEQIRAFLAGEASALPTF